METNLKFNAKKCFDYINGIEDFSIVFETKPSYDDASETIMYVGEMMEVKSFLGAFILKCKQESQQDDYDFVKWLRQRRTHWKMQQYRIIGSLNDILAAAKGEETAELERKLKRYAEFFTHNYRIIEMIINDVMNNFSEISGPSDNNKMLLQDVSAKSLDELFKDGIDPEPCFQLLRDHEYPLIGSEYNYVSKALKSGFCIWIYELERHDIIEHQPDKVYAELLLKKISGLKVFDESIFRKTNNKADNRYKEYFKKRIAEVKQAQPAQSARL